MTTLKWLILQRISQRRDINLWEKIMRQLLQSSREKRFLNSIRNLFNRGPIHLWTCRYQFYHKTISRLPIILTFSLRLIETLKTEEIFLLSNRVLNTINHSLIKLLRERMKTKKNMEVRITFHMVNSSRSQIQLLQFRFKFYLTHIEAMKARCSQMKMSEVWAEDPEQREMLWRARLALQTLTITKTTKDKAQRNLMERGVSRGWKRI